MAGVILKGERREHLGKAQVKKLRGEGKVPGIVYGPSIDSTPIAITRKDLQALFAQITRSSRINLAVAGEDGTKEMDVFLKVVDYDPVTDEPKHVDFYHPDVGRALKLYVPVKVTGEAKGVKSGGILSVTVGSSATPGVTPLMLQNSQSKGVPFWGRDSKLKVGSVCGAQNLAGIFSGIEWPRQNE